MTTYVHKPTTVEAVQIKRIADDEVEFDTDAPEWLLDAFAKGSGEIGGAEIMHGSLFISTLEGVMRIDVGDWVIKGTVGEIYGVKENVFGHSYEPVRRDYGHKRKTA